MSSDPYVLEKIGHKHYFLGCNLIQNWSSWFVQISAEPSADHDDVIIWKHFPHYWPFVRGIHRSPVNSPHKGQWRRALMFSLICAWTNGWVNNWDAGDLRPDHTHYDITVMLPSWVCFLRFYLEMLWIIFCWWALKKTAMLTPINRILNFSLLTWLHNLKWTIKFQNFESLGALYHMVQDTKDIRIDNFPDSFMNWYLENMAR